MPDVNEIESPVYSVDCFTLLLRMDLTNLWELVRSQHLEDHARMVRPLGVGPQMIGSGYRSGLTVAKFDGEILPTLSRYLRDTDYRIVYTEITCDVPVETEQDARHRAKRVTKVLRKLYSPEVRRYTDSDEIEDILNRERTPRRLSLYEHELLSYETAYTGGKSFEYKVYARKIPGTEQPAVRSEWMIQKTATIRRTTGVRTIRDLHNLNVEEVFLGLYRKFIRYEAINRVRHGLFVLNLPYNSPYADRETVTIRGIDYMGPTKASYAMTHQNDIEIAAQLRKHYLDEKKRIETKSRRHRNLTELESRIQNLSPTRLKSFFVPVPDPFLEEGPNATLS